ncbi:MAG TPA: hypothetical protein VFA83_24090 [Acidimicrobiales bacterium]|nr:hypothetical protein [Acidimicrobiales bacterium]
MGAAVVMVDVEGADEEVVLARVATLAGAWLQAALRRATTAITRRVGPLLLRFVRSARFVQQ